MSASHSQPVEEHATLQEAAAIYQHEPLKPSHIRLASILPGHDPDVLQISIRQVLFSSSEAHVPRYHALSYAWGTQIDPIAIQIVHSENHNSSERVPTSHPILQATQSLAFALYQFRKENETAGRQLWIDAICIDQLNLAEKSLEVTKMGEIYRHAEKVIVWLGTAHDDSDLAIQSLSDLAEMADEETLFEKFEDETFIPEMPVYDERTWQAISALVNRSWFTRIWIRQEILLSNQDTAWIQCGDDSISWKSLKTAMMVLHLFMVQPGPQENGDEFKEGFDMALNLIATALPTQDASDLTSLDMWKLLELTRGCHCQDPRDRVYAIVGLAADRVILNLSCNYEKTVEQVYRDLAIAHLKTEQALKLLTHCDAAAWTEDQPSWVPQYHKKSPYPRVLKYHASSFETGRVTTHDDILTVKGVHCGSVAKCSKAAPSSLNKQDIGPQIDSWLKADFLTSDRLGEFIVTVMNGRSRERYPDCHMIPTESQALTLLRNLTATLGSTSDAAELRRTEDFFYRLMHNLAGRKLFTTDQGCIGLGPALTTNGDQIFAILGCPSLMVLRPTTEGHYRIVGECILGKHMDLEPLLGPLPPSGWRLEYEDIGGLPYDMRFEDPNSGSKSPIDPRMDVKVEGWLSEERNENSDIVWESIETGQRTPHDPRHSDVEFLRNRGVNVIDISLA